jgi:transposase
MLYPGSAVERAVQIKEVLLRAMNKEYSWLRAAEILGITARGLRRLRKRMEDFGYEGLVDMRRGRPSPRRTPVVEIERILTLYREKYTGFNARHFYDTVRRAHDVKLSYSCVRQILQGAGLVKKARARGRHRLKRERKACFGEMLHIDGSRHCWLTLVAGAKQTLIQVVDDATSRLLYAQLWTGETTVAVMTALREVVREFGIPISLYSDRASWAFETPKAGAAVDKAHLTQVGEALARLGVEHIPAYSPQARGRSERLNRTLQDRMVNELRAEAIEVVEEANRYLRERYLPAHNEVFAREPRDMQSAFAELGETDLDEIFFEREVRTVGRDNTVSISSSVRPRGGPLLLQIHKQPGRPTCAGLAVEVRKHLDQSFSIWRGTQLFGRYEPDGVPLRSDREKVKRQDGPGATQSTGGRARVHPDQARYEHGPQPVEAAGPVENRERRRFPTRTLDVGKRRRRPQLPQALPLAKA